MIASKNGFDATSDSNTAMAEHGGKQDDLEVVGSREARIGSAGRAKYKGEGSSLGNKLLVALPILHVTMSIIFVTCSYIYAYEKHGNSFMENGHNVPFISDLGNDKPQSSLFTFGMVVTALLSLFIVATRYFQVKHFFVKYDGKLNTASFIFGAVFVLGKIIASCFQMSTQRETHFVGAGLYVILASVYASIQTFITYKNRQLFGKQRSAIIAISRALLSLGMIIGTVIFLVFLLPDLVKHNKSGESVSQGAEWFFAVCKMFFMLTFVVDFWYLHPRWLLIKPNNEAFSDLVLSNVATENGTAAVATIVKDAPVPNDNALEIIKE